MNGHGDAGDRSRLSRRRVLAASGAIGAGLLAGCSGNGGDDGGSSDGNSADDGSGGGDDGSMDDGSGDSGESMDAEMTWRMTELTDVLTEETFSIGGLEGPVAIQSFAVWCPKCERQSRELSNIDESGLVLIVISLYYLFVVFEIAGSLG